MMSRFGSRDVSRSRASFCRQFNRQARAASRAALQANGSVELRHALADADEAEPVGAIGRSRLGRIKPNAIILDRDEERVR